MKSKEEMLNYAITSSYGNDDWGYWELGQKEALSAMQAYADQSVEAALKKEWVPISDDKPKADALYNVCYPMPNGNWHVFTTGYSISFKRFDEGNCNITHWMPLPTPPNI